MMNTRMTNCMRRHGFIPTIHGLTYVGDSERWYDGKMRKTVIYEGYCIHNGKLDYMWYEYTESDNKPMYGRKYNDKLWCYKYNVR